MDELIITFKNIEEIYEFVELSKKFTSDIDLVSIQSSDCVDAKSIVGVLALSNSDTKFITRIIGQDNSEIIDFKQVMKRFEVIRE